MNHPTSLETVTKVSHGIREEVNVSGWLRIEKGSLIFDESSIKLLEVAVQDIFKKLMEIQKTIEVPQVERVVVGNVEVIMTSPKKKRLARIGEALQNLKKRKKEEIKKDTPLSMMKVSPDPFWEIYIIYTDEKGVKTLPTPLTVRLSDNGLDWKTYWTVLSNALGKKYQFARIILERKESGTL